MERGGGLDPAMLGVRTNLPLTPPARPKPLRRGEGPALSPPAATARQRGESDVAKEDASSLRPRLITVVRSLAEEAAD
jgi:hypothetical protein